MKPRFTRHFENWSRSFAKRGAPDRRRNFSTLVLVACAAAPAALAQSTEADAVRRRLATELANAPAGLTVGLVVEEVGGSRWFEQNGDELMKPASVLKLFTTAAALDRFGPEFNFETRFYLRGQELWVIGAGDPGLGDERIARRRGEPIDAIFDRLAARLKEIGGAELEKIVLDDSIFDQQWRHIDWPIDQSDRWYQAPVGGLNLNDNCLDARVRIRDGKAVLLLTPALSSNFWTNGIRVGAPHRPMVRRAPDSDVFRFSGTVRKDDELAPVCAHRPTVFFGHALRAELERRGIRIRADVVRRFVSAEAIRNHAPLLVHHTPLEDVLWRCNTHSQNLFAECLLKALAAYTPSGQRSGESGSWDRGVDLARETLLKMGVPIASARIRDGSGLSHQNRVSAAQIVALLQAMNSHPHAGAFRKSLAVSGAEGTMQRRLAEPGLANRLIGKTGSIAGVSTLAGYLSRPDGVEIAFALVMNGNASGDLAARVCRALVRD